MFCFQCKKPLPEYGSIIINLDGDMVCSKQCKETYEKAKAYFFNVLIHDEQKFLACLLN